MTVTRRETDSRARALPEVRDTGTMARALPEMYTDIVISYFARRRFPAGSHTNQSVEERQRAVWSRAALFFLVAAKAELIERRNVVRALQHILAWSKLQVRRPRPAELSRPPGIGSAKLLRTIFGDRAADEVFDPHIADVQFEYFDALQKGSKWQARFVLVRGHIGVVAAVLRYLRVYGFLQRVFALAKGLGGG